MSHITFECTIYGRDDWASLFTFKIVEWNNLLTTDGICYIIVGPFHLKCVLYNPI